MNDATNTLNEAIAMLSHSQSAKRRSGAKRLRKLGDIRAGDALLQALKKEIQDPRTWETQYQLIAAIGACKFREALPYLRELAARPFEATMIYDAVGDAMVRLSRKADDDVDVLLELIKSDNPHLITGGMQAMAMLKIVPDAKTVSQLISYVRLTYAKDKNDWSIIWVLRAAPGWKGAIVEQFLQECAKIPFEQNQQLHMATELALARKYQKWSPL